MKVRGFDPKSAKDRPENARAIIMDGGHPALHCANAALAGDLFDLIEKDRLLDLSDDPLGILKEQFEPIWAGDPIRSRYAAKLVSAILTVVDGSSTTVLTSMAAPSQRANLNKGTSADDDPMFCPLPLTSPRQTDQAIP